MPNQIAHSIRPSILLLVASALLLAATGCCGVYDRTPTGKLGGKYSLVWVSADYFAYIPDANDPFYFQRASGEKIIPKAMYTDGGSIPRELWSLRNYSPWTYGPAYLMHDWLFVAHDCGPADYQQYTLETSADVMAECMKTLMVEKKAPMSKATLGIIYTAVRTPIARHLWDEPSDCQQSPGPMSVSPKHFAHGIIRPGAGKILPESVQTERYKVDVDMNQPMPNP